MKLINVRGRTRSRRAGSTGACGLMRSTACRIWVSRSSSRASSMASSTARFSARCSARTAFLSGLSDWVVSSVRSDVWLVAPCPAASARASLACRDDSSTASRSRWARSRASLRRVARVERLSAMGWSMGRQSATVSGPRTPTADATARSAPTRRPSVTRSWETSMRSSRSPAAISPMRRSVRITVPERSTRIASPTSRRCAMRRDCRARTCSQVSRSRSSVISSSASESRERPPVCS
ncbi:hypothetical protein STENM223S_12005 [Streptomyces tendae]